MCLSAAWGSRSLAAAVELCVPGFVCVHAFPLPSFLSLFRPAWSVRLPAEHAGAKYTHISKHSTTTDRVLSGQRKAGNRSKEGKTQRGVHSGKEKKRGNRELKR